MESYLRRLWCCWLAVLIAGIGLVAVAFTAARVVAPRRQFAEKLTTYECGIDPVGEGWAQTQIRYYIYALPVRDLRRRERLLVPLGVRSSSAWACRPWSRWGIFIFHPGPGPALRLPKEGVAVGLMDQVDMPQPVKFLLNWGRRYSLWVMNFGLACCAIELIATSTSKHDFIRLGVIPFAHGPRQADLLVVAGTLTDKMAPALKRVYDQIPDPKYVISFGSCSNCGGPYWDSYSVTKGVDQWCRSTSTCPGARRGPRPCSTASSGSRRRSRRKTSERSGVASLSSQSPLRPTEIITRLRAQFGQDVVRADEVHGHAVLIVTGERYHDIARSFVTTATWTATTSTSSPRWTSRRRAGASRSSRTCTRRAETTTRA